MPRFKNRTRIRQVLQLPSRHLRVDGTYCTWDSTPARKILEPDEILETSVESDLEYLRGLAAEQLVHVQGERKKVPGVLIEIEGE